MAHSIGDAPEIVVVDDAAALADEAMRRIEAALLGAPDDRRSRIVLAGGTTPTPAYRHLASRPLPWGRIEIFFSDERCVAPAHDASNYRMVHEALLERIPITLAAVHRIPGEIPAADAAAQAEQDLRNSSDGGLPEIDLAVLGMGADGHVASLFPGDPAAWETRALAIPVAGNPARVSLTLPVLNGARARLLMVDGEDKAAALARAVAGDGELPAGRLAASGTTWLVTAAAAGHLDQRP